MNLIVGSNVYSPAFRANVNKFSKELLLRQFEELYGDISASDIVRQLGHENLKYLYFLASKVDLSGYNRIEYKYLEPFSQIELHKLKEIEPLLLSKNDLGLWNYSADFVLNFPSLNKKQQTTLLNLVQCNVTPFSTKGIIENPDLNWDKMVDKAKAIKAHYKENLREIEFYSNTKGENFFLADVQLPGNDKPKWLNYKRITIKMDDNVNPYARRNKRTPIDPLIEKLYSKLTGEMNIYSENDLNSDIRRIAGEVPAASNSEILTTIRKLTQFANYSSLPAMAEQLTKHGVTSFDDVGELHKYFQYFHDNKGLFKLAKSKEKRGCIVTLKDLNDEKTFQSISQKVKENKLTLIHLEGFSEGINLFTDDRKLAARTVNILKKAKSVQLKNPELDFEDCVSYVLNNPIDSKLKENGLNAIRVSFDNPSTPAGILGQIQPVTPSKERIQTTIEAIADKYSTTKKEYKKLSNSIVEYFNSNTRIYSKQSMIESLKEMNNRIQDYLQEHNIPKENLYLIKDKIGNVKSFDILIKMYKDLFNFPSNKIIEISDMKDLNEYPSNSAFVILDDIVGTGDSILSCGNYFISSEKINKDKFIIFAPIVWTKVGLETINGHILKHARNNNDTTICIDKNIFKNNSNCKIFEYWYLNLKSLFIPSGINDKGFDEQALSISFPYMAPDNNSFVSANLLDLFLINKSCIKSKPYTFDILKTRAEDYDIFGQEEKYLKPNSPNDKAPGFFEKIKIFIQSKHNKK